MDIHSWTHRLTSAMRVAFANALYCQMPSLLGNESIWDVITTCEVCVAIAGHICCDKIYIDAIYFARHFADHGADYGVRSRSLTYTQCTFFLSYESINYILPAMHIYIYIYIFQAHWDDERIHDEICEHFPGFIAWRTLFEK